MWIILLHFFITLCRIFYIRSVDFLEELKRRASQPLTHQLLVSLLKGYHRPNAKIHSLLRRGLLQPVKKGLYIVGPGLNASKQPNPLLLANHILGPSYVSLETALAYHGLIPERVYEVTSMTTKAARKFVTPVATFTYTKLRLPYYSFGIDSVKLADDQYALLASPEKAICDKIVTMQGMLFRSRKSAREFLVENMRIDENKLNQLNTSEIRTWLKDAPKKESLTILINTINEL